MNAKVELRQEQFLPEENHDKNTDPRRHNRGFAKGFASGVIVAAVVAAAALFGLSRSSLVRLYISPSSSSEALLDDETEEKIETISAYILSDYYEDVDTEELRDGLFDGLFENLDSYSRYYTAEEYEELLENTLEGTYCGIGAGLQQNTDTMLVTIVHVYDDSPAQEAGLQEGDVIIEVDGVDATSMEVEELAELVRGEEGTSVHLVTYRGEDTIEYDIVRRSMDYPTVESEMLEDSVGYIAVSEFTQATTDQFVSALEDLESQGMESLIVDLRWNPGGVLSSVCDILDEILPEGLILYTEDANGTRVEYTTTDTVSLDVPLVVLVNGSSASASEIFAGAVQDRDAGTIVGTTTYGKGVVQTVHTLADGSAFKLTTQTYYTPGGTCIQGIGITPDVEIEYEFLGGEDDSYSYDLDNQIQKALEILQAE
ncbi:MAG: S41 family peptidase [Lachnospiraceae bacterium]|nr:S41 family peptidase [Lachnospiraceae bacterium]